MGALPRSVVVVGAATGCQLASVLAAFGARVRLLEVAPRILGGEAEVLSASVAETFERRGIEISTGIEGLRGSKSPATGVG
jgi:pyruvate/2-oxoglutarate dehydrogenase complex dihydrolipoamide dehydrogenase (E3) component